MKKIPNFPGYFVTEDGQVWSNPRKDGPNTKGCFLRLRTDKDGYKICTFSKAGKRFDKKVHRLVLKTFTGPCPSGRQCRHLDNNPANNNLNNLRWGTPKENAIDRDEHGTTYHPKGEKQGGHKLTEQDVRTIVYMWRTKLFKQKEIAKIYRVRKQTICSILGRKSWGHIWVK